MSAEPYERVVRRPRWTSATFETVARVIHDAECDCGRPGTVHRRTAATVLDALANVGALVEPAGDGG